MCYLKFVATIRRRGPEIIQFYGEDTFSSVRRNSKEKFLHSQ